ARREARGQRTGRVPERASDPPGPSYHTARPELKPVWQYEDATFTYPGCTCRHGAFIERPRAAVENDRLEIAHPALQVRAFIRRIGHEQEIVLPVFPVNDDELVQVRTAPKNRGVVSAAEQNAAF